MPTNESEPKHTLTDKIEETLQLVSDFFIRYLRTAWRTVFCPNVYRHGAKNLLDDSRLLAPVTFFVVTTIAGMLLLKHSNLARRAGTSETVKFIINGIKDSSETEILLWLIPVFLIYALLSHAICWCSRRLLHVGAPSAEKLLAYTTGAMGLLLTFNVAIAPLVLSLADKVGGGTSIVPAICAAVLVDGAAALLPAVYFVRGMISGKETSSRLRKTLFILMVFAFQISVYATMIGGWKFQDWLSKESTKGRSNPSVSFLLAKVIQTSTNGQRTLQFVGAFRSDSDTPMIFPKRDNILVRIDKPLTTAPQSPDVRAPGYLTPLNSGADGGSMVAQWVESDENANPFFILQKNKWAWCKMDFPISPACSKILGDQKPGDFRYTLEFFCIDTHEGGMVNVVVPNLLERGVKHGITISDKNSDGSTTDR